MAARLTAAKAILAEYQRALETADTIERAMWGTRLSDALESVLDAEADLSGVAQPGGGWISGPSR